MSGGKKSRSSSRRRSARRQVPAAEPLKPGQQAQAPGLTLRSFQVGALPLVNQILERMRLEAFFQEYLPPDDPRCQFPTAQALLVLVRNVLLSREPVYAVGAWAAEFAPDLFNLWEEQVALLHDDRLGRCLTRLFVGTGPELILAVVRHVIAEFQVSLDELHNDSTTVSFYGAYDEAAEEGLRLGRATHAITWGHSKARRPDLKQLLYTLTVSSDGSVPVYFTSHSGNVADDTTHCATWELLQQLVGSSDFLYVADCKLASEENLGYIARRGGRFVTVMPRTHGEDEQFRAKLRQSSDAVRWEPLYDVTDEEGNVTDQLFVDADEALSSEGYRLLWYRSTRKAELDLASRARRVQRAWAGLTELRERLSSPRTRFRERGKVQRAVEDLLARCEVESWIRVSIEEREDATYRQSAQRPGATTVLATVVPCSEPDRIFLRTIPRPRPGLSGWGDVSVALGQRRRESVRFRGVFRLRRWRYFPAQDASGPAWLPCQWQSVLGRAGGRWNPIGSPVRPSETGCPSGSAGGLK